MGVAAGIRADCLEHSECLRESLGHSVCLNGCCQVTTMPQRMGVFGAWIVACKGGGRFGATRCDI